jgi:hypothetical protein
VDRRLPQGRIRAAAAAGPAAGHRGRDGGHAQALRGLERHTIQVDFDDYLHALGKERRAGAERARRQGFTLPVVARATRAQVPA